MRIKSNTRVEIGRLFSSLAYGECMSHDCAAQQANMRAVDPNRFFIRQARQELYHAKVFNRVVLYITPRGPKPVPPTLRAFRTRLERACQRNDLVETLVGQQIVLEGLGGLILEKMDKKFDQRRLGFKRILKILLYQERGHQAFGHRMVSGLITAGITTKEHIHNLTSEYLFLVDRILDDLQPMFEVVGADANQYKIELQECLRDWIIP